ncbi:hypothetical protein N0V85_006049 [Neurospora sp. IMI 360204]|nr:hypothetical protein N0V85_006049 [Neurospora sp. IMI 360204]
MTTTPEELSAIWRKLPIELVQEVLTHFIDDLLSTTSGIPILAGPVESEEEGQDRAADLELYANGLLRLWQKWRHDSLFTHQRKRIEQHFRDVWLNAMTFYLHVEYNGEDLPLFCRYLPFVWQGPPDPEYIYPSIPPEDDDTPTATGSGSDSESDWATFYLHGPLFQSETALDERSTPRRMLRWDELQDAAVEAWETKFDETTRLEIGLRPRSEEFHYTPDHDVLILPLWMGAWLPGLQVLDDGHPIDFKWKELVDVYLETFAAEMKGGVEDG